MKIGYIRVSKDKQATALQEDALRQAQYERTFIDKMTGKRFDRPEFVKMTEVAFYWMTISAHSGTKLSPPRTRSF